MRIGLFIPCYVDQFFPDVGLATVELLERFAAGASIEFPQAQTCCGQPMVNSGCNQEGAVLAERFLDIFEPFDAIVAPSGSCVAMVRSHYADLLDDHDRVNQIAGKTYELCEYLTDQLGVTEIGGRFPHRVGLHQSCHGLRELRLASCSERMGPAHGKARVLLESIDQLELVELSRADECCGFGGTFAVDEEAISCAMGDDCIANHEQAGTQVLTANDMSCLMHLEGRLRRQGSPIKVMHIAQILAGRTPSSSDEKVAVPATP